MKTRSDVGSTTVIVAPTEWSLAGGSKPQFFLQTHQVRSALKVIMYKIYAYYVYVRYLYKYYLFYLSQGW